MQDVQWAPYIQRTACSGEWGDYLTLRAAAEICGAVIHVISLLPEGNAADTKFELQRTCNSPIFWPVKGDIWLLYNGRDHYDRLEAKVRLNGPQPAAPIALSHDAWNQLRKPTVVHHKDEPRTQQVSDVEDDSLKGSPPSTLLLRSVNVSGLDACCSPVQDAPADLQFVQETWAAASLQKALAIRLQSYGWSCVWGHPQSQRRSDRFIPFDGQIGGVATLYKTSPPTVAAPLAGHLYSSGRVLHTRTMLGQSRFLHVFTFIFQVRHLALPTTDT